MASTPSSPVVTGKPGSSTSLPRTNSGTSSHPPLSASLKPIGITNEGNTCFLNSTFQALSATAPITTLLAHSPISPLILQPNSILPDPAVPLTLIPSLHPDVLEPPLYGLLPVTHTFTESLHKAWRMKDLMGGTSGMGEERPGRTMSLRNLLKEMVKKYDQYNDYDQQDAHELLRHLLDSMEMEEKDVIKKLQPNPPMRKKRRKGKRSGQGQGQGQGQAVAGGVNGAALENGLQLQNHLDLRHISPMASPLPSPAHSMPASPSIAARLDPMNMAGINHDGGLGEVTGRVMTEEPADDPAQAVVAVPENGGSGRVAEVLTDLEEEDEEERLIPWVDVLFGGSLASVVVCEKCKAVSHTYEGFLDISLALKGDDPKPRKRDRLRAMANKLRPRGSSAKPAPSPEVQPTLNLLHSHAVSDGEMSDGEGAAREAALGDRDRRRSSLDGEDREDRRLGDGSSNLGRSSSSRGFSGLKPKASFSFRRKQPRASSSSSSVNLAIASPSDGERTPPAPPSIPTSPKPAHPHHQHHLPHHQAGPTPAQAAYIARILAPPPGSSVDANDPLAKLRAAQSGQVIEVAPQSTGLVDSLKAFTSVEVLEGENAFACKKCWRIKHGKYQHHEKTVPEEDEEGEHHASHGAASPGRRPGSKTLPSANSVSTMSTVSNASSILTSPRAGTAPSIAIASPKSDKQAQLEDTHLRPGRSTSLNHSQSQMRAPSPLRRQVEEEEVLVEQMSSTTLDSSFTSHDSNSGSFADPSDAGDHEGEADADAEAEDDDCSSEESSDGLSDSETESEDGKEKGKGKGGRPKAQRRKSRHFVMGRAFKRYLIAKAPEILVFHFKRFKQTHTTNYGFTTSFAQLKKMDDFVSFPENLDLAPFLAPNRRDYKVNQTPNGPHATYMDWKDPEKGPDLEPVMYKLYALVVHMGTMTTGHYIAYCLIDPEQMFGKDGAAAAGLASGSQTPTEGMSPALGRGPSAATGVVEEGEQAQTPSAGPKGEKKDRRVWCFCSDTTIRLASVEEVLSARAYLCFYEKVNH
ncbi:hypothetical protein IAT38_000481 [Cryptococcus sp. DSM 104549]